MICKFCLKNVILIKTMVIFFNVMNQEYLVLDIRCTLCEFLECFSLPLDTRTLFCFV